MSIARLVSSMKAAGCTAEQIGTAVMAFSDGNARSSAAERQARYRERGGGRIPRDLREAVFKRDGFECQACGKKEDLCCDHVTPVSKGGLTVIENLSTLCRPCNSEKKDGDAPPINKSRNVTHNVTPSHNANADAKCDVSDAPLVRAFSVGEEVNIPPENATHSTPKGEKTKRADRGIRLPEDWRPNDEDRIWSVEQLGSNSAARNQLEQFRDYWRAKAGAAARKVDWDGTWRNWVRKAAENQPRPPPRGQAGSFSTRMNALQELFNECSDDPDEGPGGPSWPNAPGSPVGVGDWHSRTRQ